MSATTQKNQPATYQVGSTVEVDPASLLVDVNVRTETRIDRDFVASIRDHGVLQPIVAVLTSDGEVRVRYGQRRTLAAIEAKRATVPVYIAGTEDDPGADEKAARAAGIDRIIKQRAENHDRAGLTTSEDIAVVAQLAAFGLSPAQIAKRTRITRPDVDAALTVAGSEVASRASARWDNLTLDQVAAVAEFEDDAETVKALVVAASEGQFEHVAQRARDQRAEQTARQVVVDGLTETGVTVVEPPEYGDDTTVRLTRLCASTDERQTSLADPESGGIEGHAQCPGHVAWISTAWVRVDADGQEVEFPDEPADPEVETTGDQEADDAAAEQAMHEAWEAYEQQCAAIRADSRQVQRPAPEYGCQGWREHGHHDRHDYGSGSGYGSGYGSGSGRPKAADLTPEEREKAKADRKTVIENNKAWASAETVRREWLATYTKVKTPPKGTGAFLATALALDPEALHSVEGNHLAAGWLGKKPGPYGRVDLSPAKTTTENRATVLALVQVLAGYEANLTDRSWRDDGTRNSTGRYLRFLAACGYPLADVEKYATSNKTV